MSTHSTSPQPSGGTGDGYVAPALTVLGSVGDLTLVTTFGPLGDALGTGNHQGLS